ncbi:MAG: hypothetical protein ACRD0N_07265 [Acidimicrobiales bacterium]
MTGADIVKASWAGTAALTVAAAVAVAVKDAGVVLLAVSLVLFTGGSVAFAAALLKAAHRSRREELFLAGLFFLSGAPTAVRRHLLGSLAVEVVVALTAAGVRPNSSVAFGVLAPMWGQGLAGLWGARHGTFPSRAKGPRDRV